MIAGNPCSSSLVTYPFQGVHPIIKKKYDGEGMSQSDNQIRGRLPVSAGLILGLVCFLWGVNALAIKFSNQGMPPIMAAALRSLVSGALVWAYARIKGRGVAFPPGQTRHAIVIGLLFGLEFLFVYWGLSFTPASRSLIFLYTHPFWVALGAHFFYEATV